MMSLTIFNYREFLSTNSEYADLASVAASLETNDPADENDGRTPYVNGMMLITTGGDPLYFDVSVHSNEQKQATLAGLYKLQTAINGLIEGISSVAVPTSEELQALHEARHAEWEAKLAAKGGDEVAVACGTDAGVN